MKYFILTLIFSFSNAITTEACSCSAQPSLDIRSLNDSELIFTATLLEYKIGMSAVSLKLKPLQVYKGDLKDTIFIYLKPKNIHTFFNKSVKFNKEENWIIFARKKAIGNKTYYRLTDSEGSSFCALSRPVEKNPEKDSYLKFLVKKAKQPNGFQQIFDAEDKLIAEGSYENNRPIEVWKYYRTNGRPDISGEYKFGKKNGVWIKYNSSTKGTPRVIQKRIYDQGELKEIHDLNYSGTVLFKKFLSDTAEIRHYFFGDGTINSIIHKRLEYDSMRTTSFHKNGTIREEKYFKEKKLLRKNIYNENGLKIEEWVKKD